MNRLFICAGLALSISACGGSDSPRLPAQSSSSSLVSSSISSSAQSSIQSSVSSNSSAQSSSLGQVKPADLSPTAMEVVAAEDLEAWLKNGLRLSTTQGFIDNWVGGIEFAAPQPGVDFSPAPPSGPAFSGTNVQVAGVDEADFVKYDGAHLFYAVPPLSTNTGYEQKIRIVRTDPDLAQLHPQSDIHLSTGAWGESPELYLVADDEAGTQGLATLRRATSYIDFSQLDSLWHYPIGEPGVEVRVYDVSNPAQPGDAWELTLDGDLLGSRKIGNVLYLVTGHYPLLPEIQPFSNSDAVLAQNENHIAASSIQRLLPHYRVGDDEEQPLIDPDTCLLPQDRSANQGHQQLVSLVAIDLEARALVDSLCVSTPVHGLYVSSSAIYLGASGSGHFFETGNHTLVHKFAIAAEGFEYQATGAVKGQLGWDNPAFRMDEYQGDLRLVTTSHPGPVHRLSILRPNTTTKSMDVVAQIPNSQQPAPIGKPNEEIYAVRFDGARAFVVTFEQIDPLYVLDLSDHAAPQIAGELEIPGFSTYLHPIDQNLLFAVGQSGGVSSNLKLSLFDISDMSQPKEINLINFSGFGAWSIAQYDHRALSFLRVSDDTLRITLPVQSYNGFFQGGPTASGLYQLEVRNIGSESAVLTNLGNIPNQSYGTGLGERGILHGDSVFYVRSDKVSAHSWPTD